VRIIPHKLREARRPTPSRCVEVDGSVQLLLTAAAESAAFENELLGGRGPEAEIAVGTQDHVIDALVGGTGVGTFREDRGRARLAVCHAVRIGVA
jgi:hypothetical protein